MSLEGENNHCLFCLNAIHPYNVDNEVEVSVGEGVGGEQGLINNRNIPNFEDLCHYLQLKYPDQCYRPNRAGSGDANGQQSIFKASCDKFLCWICFGRVDNLRALYKEWEGIKEKIGVVRKDIKRVIGGGTELVEPECGFAKVFENHLRQVTESSSIWKGEGNILDAFMEIKEEVVEEYVVMDVEHEEALEEQTGSIILTEEEVRREVYISEDESTVNNGAGASVSIFQGQDADGKFLKNPETAAATQKLLEIAGQICCPSIKQDTSSGEAKIERKPVFECRHCAKCYASIRNLEVHIAVKHGRNRKKGKGNAEGISRDKFSLRAKTEVEVDGRKLFMCPHCKKYYDKVKALRNHIARNHATGSSTKKSPVVTCALCPTYKTFKNENLLQKHVFASHTTGSKFKCDHCGKQYHSKQSLKGHVDTEHKGIRYHCSHCPKYFSQPTQLKHHVKLVHFRDGLLKCNQCSREFTRQCDLEAHLLIHDPNAPKNHICDVCGKEFLTRSGLADHMRVHNERRYQCTHCPDKFKKRSHLVGHLRKHTGEKPFTCGVCERAFAVKSTLTTHMKTHEGSPRKRGRKRKQEEGTTEELGGEDADGNAGGETQQMVLEVQSEEI